MKFTPFLLLLTISLACGNRSARAETETASAAPDAAITSPPTINAEPPCETFSGADVATAFDWGGSTDGEAATMRDGRLQSCRFMSTGNSGQASFTISHSDARIIEKKYLESAFTRDLARKDDRLTSREVSGGPGDQALYTTGRRGPHHLYKLRWRKGNETDYDITLRATKKQDKTAILETLLELAARM